MIQNESEHFDFDLADLLKLEGFKIRELAGADRTLTVGEYYRMLTRFLEVAGEALPALKSLIKIEEASPADWENIQTMITLLKFLGFDKFALDLESVNIARADGNFELASAFAKKLRSDFIDLVTRIECAKTMKAASGADDHATGDVSLSSPLYQYIKYLDFEKNKQKPMVLAVDDSPDVLAAISGMLSEKYKVFKLPKPKMLESVLQQVTPKLFLMDLQMPEMNGVDLIPVIRGFDKHKDTPIIFVSAASSVDDLSTAVALGASDSIIKPCSADTLQEKSEKHISKS
jgi:CheY-like chemotaxis protein